jgi:20S proteasome subunit alpha 6
LCVSFYSIFSISTNGRSSQSVAGSLEDLVRHGLHALRETLQQDKELNVNNTSIGIVGPKSEFETREAPGGNFRILENDDVEPFLQTMIAKESPDAPAPAATAPPPAATAGDDDVTMAG